MNKNINYEKVLSFLNQHEFQNQRKLALETGMSLGTVNGLLRELEAEGYLTKEEKNYTLTECGEHYLEMMRAERQENRLLMESDRRRIRTAVILAAGENRNFSCPVGLLQINGTYVIDRILQLLRQNGVERICVVIGYQQEQYRTHFADTSVRLVENPRYKWSGTMESLALASEFIEEDFLLVESNQIFEGKAIEAVLQQPAANCVLMTVPSGSRDEAYVELGREQTVFRISKDIRQLNHIDGEMLGVSKVTYRLFCKMLEYFRDNTNPMLNYEYVMEAIGRIYRIQGVLLNDLYWSVIENRKHYEQIKNRLYPRMVKRERLQQKNRAREVLRCCLKLPPAEPIQVHIGGGMTNTNFFVTVREQEYVLRIPGACTGEMIDRRSEWHNSALAAAEGLNPLNLYFDPETGVKVTECIAKAVTLNGKTARLEEMMKKTTELLRRLHSSGMKQYGAFSVQREYEKYKAMGLKAGVTWYEGFEKLDRFFYQLLRRLEVLGTECCPCHNDLVPENLVLSGEGRLYLIDWEYSGCNDPMWDLASHLLECEFERDEEELFLQYYFQGPVAAESLEKIRIYQICQDLLWSAWTILKEREGEEFGTYGPERFQRAERMKEEYEEQYGTATE